MFSHLRVALLVFLFLPFQLGTLAQLAAIGHKSFASTIIMTHLDCFSFGKVCEWGPVFHLDLMHINGQFGGHTHILAFFFSSVFALWS